MITKELITKLANEHLEGSPLSLVRVKVTKENDISIFITRRGGSVGIEDCVELSRYVESRLDRDKEDFSLMVSSAGKAGSRDEDEEDEAAEI